MRNWIFKFPGKRSRFNWLALDSWIDSSIYESWEGFRNWWSAVSSFFARFKLTGLRRWFNELLSEGLTMGTGALVVMLSFAIPAFEETRTAWQTAGKFSVTFLDRDGNEIGKRGILHSDAVPLDEIPAFLIQATLATEDRRFYHHFGIDVIGTLRAMVENVRAKDVVQGGSSITQQLAKNLFLSPERSLERKINEAFLAIWLEARLTKNEILKFYLDRAYLGGGAFGVEAAAQFYFGKSVRDIQLNEAAMMAGLFKAPTRFAPHIDLPAARARANVVLSNLVDAGFLTEGQVHGARLNPADIVDRSDYYSPDWFLDWAFEQIQEVMRDKNEYVLTARTTVDTNLQKAAEQAVQNTLRRDGRSRHADQAALVSMETDGAVRALVGGKDYGESQFNRATHALRQPGSSFKPYVYLTALLNGFKPTTIVVDGPVGCGRWSPRNYSGGFSGSMQMQEALMRSINTVAVKLSLQVGREKLLDTVNKIGLAGIQKTCSMALGDTGITPLQHTGGYAVFASGGLTTNPYAIDEVTNSRGELVYSHERDAPKREQLFDRSKIEDLNRMLALVVTSGTGRRAQLEFTSAVGKTGTSSSFRDAWFMGFTGQYVTGVWFGNDNYTPMARVTGGSLPAATWHEYMVFAHQTRNVPLIPGLQPHPGQIAEQQRLDALPRTFASTAQPGSSSASRKLSPDTKKTLEAIANRLKESSQRKLDPSGGAPAQPPAGKGAANTRPDGSSASTPAGPSPSSDHRADLTR
ncbi:MAG: PBP1A family penicillin-binding protein [Pseudomonadota bacterium]|nr:PBP1A family penicillin-binding protein [Pseudomonadota bacterium]